MCLCISNTVYPVINDPAINDLLCLTTFISCTEHFSIVNDLWSTTFCLTRPATSIIWQKVIILLVSNDLNFFRHTTFGNIHKQTTACSGSLAVLATLSALILCVGPCKGMNGKQSWYNRCMYLHTLHDVDYGTIYVQVIIGCRLCSHSHHSLWH